MVVEVNRIVGAGSGDFLSKLNKIYKAHKTRGSLTGDDNGSYWPRKVCSKTVLMDCFISRIFGSRFFLLHTRAGNCCKYFIVLYTSSNLKNCPIWPTYSQKLTRQISTGTKCNSMMPSIFCLVEKLHNTTGNSLNSLWTCIHDIQINVLHSP